MSIGPLFISRLKNYINTAQLSQVKISNKIPDNLLSIQPKKKRAAVLIPLCNRHGTPSILFTLRSTSVGTHKGQVSFPGGHIDNGETAVDASIRETYEELGCTIGNIEIIGECQTVPAITGTLVSPIFGFIEQDVEDFAHLSPSPTEVDRVFSRSLEELMRPGARRVEMLSRGGAGGTIEMPVFGEEGSDERIWGLTALILDGVLQNLVIPNLPP